MLIGFCNIYAQQDKYSVGNLPRNYLIKVKQLSEFIDRFNFQKDFLNQDIGPEFESVITRNEYIRLLFDDEDKRLDPGVEDKSYQNLIESFIYKVCTDTFYIDPLSEQIYAELTCQVSINGKNKELDLLLKRETDNGLKWAVISVYPDLKSEPGFNTDKQEDKNLKDSPGSYIPPLSNETNFIDLKILLNDHENLNHLSSRDYVEENVLGFYNMIRRGALKYQHVKSLHYYLLDIPDWMMVVDNFKRNTDNSGWLISNLASKDHIHSYFKEKYDYSPAGSSDKYR
ncbi:MAG: hypothetical protein JW723_07935 [Bacteroidales bacterium]|nr:hypothetical protein [Bacteroidales bacterium]